jgi:hypothetical protein
MRAATFRLVVIALAVHATAGVSLGVTDQLVAAPINLQAHTSGGQVALSWSPEVVAVVPPST